MHSSVFNIILHLRVQIEDTKTGNLKNKITPRDPRDPALVLPRDPALVLPRDPVLVLPRDPALVPPRDPALVLSCDPALVLSRDPALVLFGQSNCIDWIIVCYIRCQDIVFLVPD